MSGSETKINDTADIGAWLADYSHTQLLTLVGRAKPDILYRPAPNRMYQSLCNVIGPRGMSMEKSGNVWEQLCWHAFEQERGSFVLAVIWNTQPRIVYAINHPLPNSEQTVATSSGYVSGERPLAEAPPPPPPPSREIPLQVPPPPPGLASSSLPYPEDTVATAAVENSPGLTMEEAAAIRRRPRPNGLHKALREYLQEVSKRHEQNPYHRKMFVPSDLPWKAYVAWHDSYLDFIGPGVAEFYLYFLSVVDRQKTRQGQLRLDYVIERFDGSYVLTHPCTRCSSDAKPRYFQPGGLQGELRNA